MLYADYRKISILTKRLLILLMFLFTTRSRREERTGRGSPVTQTVAFNGEGFEIEGESVADYSGFSLRLVLPNVKSENGEALTVTFAESQFECFELATKLRFLPRKYIDRSELYGSRQRGWSKY